MLQCCGGGEGPGRVENLVMGSLVYAPGTQNLDLQTDAHAGKKG